MIFIIWFVCHLCAQQNLTTKISTQRQQCLGSNPQSKFDMSDSLRRWRTNIKWWYSLFTIQQKTKKRYLSLCIAAARCCHGHRCLWMIIIIWIWCVPLILSSSFVCIRKKKKNRAILYSAVYFFLFFFLRVRRPFLAFLSLSYFFGRDFLLRNIIRSCVWHWWLDSYRIVPVWKMKRTLSAPLAVGALWHFYMRTRPFVKCEQTFSFFIQITALWMPSAYEKKRWNIIFTISYSRN